jgi:hypothetical protein
MIKISLYFNDDKQTIETHKITNISSKSPEQMSAPGALPARQRADNAPGVCMVSGEFLKSAFPLPDKCGSFNTGMNMSCA